MIVYLTFGFIFLAIVLFVVYRLARMSGGTINQNAAPAAPSYTWQAVLGRTFERAAAQGLDEYFENDDAPKVDNSAMERTRLGVGELAIEKFSLAS